jgi:deoxyuridine 5'-triphosphate nucleotidohydrolase
MNNERPYCKIIFQKGDSESLWLPKQQHAGDAGYDLFASKDVHLKENSVTTIETDLVIAGIQTYPWDFNIVLKIEGRSGLASKGIFPIGGIIDQNYRGPIKGLLIYLTASNGPPWGYSIKAGTRFAQLVVYPILTNDEQVRYYFSGNEYEDIEKERPLNEQTERGPNGFGSTDEIKP